MANILKELAEEQARLETELAAVKNKITAATNPKILEIADYLHARLCTYNHTDQCGYGYEGKDWAAHTHAAWLNYALRFVSRVETEDFETIKRWVDAVDGVRNA